jgi:peroxiredoxin
LPALAAPKSTTPTPAPSFTLPARHGSISIDSLRGRVVFVDFWASWCEPCRKSFPWMNTLMQQYGPRGFTVLAVSLDKRREDADTFIEHYHPAFPIAFDLDGKVAETYKVNAMPSSFLVNRAGQIVYSHPGFDPRATASVESLIVRTCEK